MSLDPLEKKLEKLKKQYDKLPSEQNADHIMSKIKERNKQETRVPLYQKRPYWKWASVCATLLVVFGVGWMFMQLFEQMPPYSSHDSESSGTDMESEEDFHIFTEEDTSNDEAYDSNSANQAPGVEQEEKEQSELMSMEFVFEWGEESFSIEVPSHISYRETAQEIIFYDEAASHNLLTIAYYESQADMDEYLEQVPGEGIQVQVPEAPRDLISLNQTSNGDESFFLWGEQRQEGYLVYTVEVQAGMMDEQLEYGIAMIHSIKWE